MAFYSFRNKNNHCDEARALIEALSMRLLGMESTLFSGQTVGNLLNGLNKVNSSHRVFRDLISRITEKIEVPEDFVPVGKQVRTWQMTPHDTFKSFCGFCNLDSDHVEVRHLLTALVDRLNRQDELLLAEIEAAATAATSGTDVEAGNTHAHPQPMGIPVLDGKVLANSFYALRNMQNNRNEVNYLLKWIELRLMDSLQALERATPGAEADAIRKKMTFNPALIAKSLCGLRSMRMPSRGKDRICTIKDTNLCRVLSAFHKLLLATTPLTPDHGTMSLEQLSVAMFGLRELHGSHPEVDLLLQYILSHHPRHLQPESLCEHSPEVLSTRLARVLYGLQGKLCDGNEGGIAFMELLDGILQHVELDFTFSSKSFCISICGLGNMNTVCNNSSALCDNDALKLCLLAGIVRRAPKIVQVGGGQHMHSGGVSEDEGELFEDSRMDRHFPSYGQVLLGLSGMSSEHADVRRALSLLVHTVDSLSSRTSDDLPDVIMGFRSLANMSSSFEEVRGMLEFLNERLLQHDFSRISYDDVSDMMLGLRNMHSTHGKVSKVLSNVNNILMEQRRDDKNGFEMRHFAAILFGLQSSSSTDGVVKKILTELCGIIADQDEGALGHITGRQLSHCLLGMQHMTLDHPEVLKVWHILLAAIDNSSSKMTRSSTEKAVSIVRARTDTTAGKELVEEMERLLNEKNNLHAASAAAVP